MIQFGMFLIASVGLLFTMIAHNKSREKGINDRIDKKADKEYVDKQDRAVHHRIDEVREDSSKAVHDLKDTINNRFDDIKELIKAIK